MDIVRSREYTSGHTTLQMNHHSGGGGDGAGILIALLLGLAGLVILSPFALPLWIMFQTAEIMNAIGVHPIIGIVAVAGVFAGIGFLVALFRPLRYVYIVLNATLIAILVYNFIFNPHAHNHNVATVIAGILFLVALIGGIVGEMALVEKLKDS